MYLKYCAILQVRGKGPVLFSFNDLIILRLSCCLAAWHITNSIQHPNSSPPQDLLFDCFMFRKMATRKGRKKWCITLYIRPTAWLSHTARHNLKTQHNGQIKSEAFTGICEYQLQCIYLQPHLKYRHSKCNDNARGFYFYVQWRPFVSSVRQVTCKM